eukprot:TRINITY_DN9278_c0_g1_i1.p1 TRINITY_DN9278_c0_g1~~TRINITY_DN9278_c0_g1_i1.p1  ORF type:complete len:1024 (-),score=260.13 TRINITY_DN9278_c0_g1_i1:155-3226(-)
MSLTEQVYQHMLTVWVELSFLVFFALGFIFLRVDHFLKGSKKETKKDFFDKQFKASVRKIIEAEAENGSPARLLKAWRGEQAKAPTPKDLTKAVAQAFLDAEPEMLVKEMLDHMALHKVALANSSTATALLDTVARWGNVEAMMGLWEGYPKLGISRSCSMYEVILGGFASAGLPERVAEFQLTMQRDRLRLSPRGFSLVIKGFLKNGLVDSVFKHIVAMSRAGYSVPSFAVAQFLRVSADAGRVIEQFRALQEQEIACGSEAACVILEECMRSHNVKLAIEVETMMRSSNVPLGQHGFDSLLKVYAESCSERVFPIFKEMQELDHPITEGFCVGLLTKCAEGKFISFAEEIVRHVRATFGMSIAVYSGIMKVYAYSGMFDKACNLYDQICEDGLEPDTMMYGCLMKFSVECGRTDLSQLLSEKMSVMDIQNYMSLIKAAGRDRDVDRAFSIIQRLRDNNVTPDAIAFNSVLDVCVKAHDLKRGSELVKQMKELKMADIVTYNTLLKGYCNVGNFKAAKELMKEMAAEGMPPNDVSFNCMLNSSVNNGHPQEAWDILAQMEEAQIKPDHYTVSIMLKALKKAPGSKQAARCFDFLDRSGIEPCSDEVLLNAVLETYIRHKDHRRLEVLLSKFEQSDLRPSVPTYGSIIKAYSTLKRVGKCWQCWEEMLGRRGLEPTDIVFGCMLDALVCNGQVEEAVQLFEKGLVKPNAVLCSILVKGFSNTQQTERAMSLWHEMQGKGVVMNTAACNAFLDSQARVGNMDEVMEIVEIMGKSGFQPDGITHSTIVKGYAVTGNLESAMEVLRSMQKAGVPHDAVVYNTIIDGCSKHRRSELVDSVLESMKAHKVAPTNFTLGILLKLYTREKKLNKAFEVMQELPKRGHFTPNSQVWSCLLGACASSNSADKAMCVFDDMLEAGQMADARATTSLIFMLLRTGRYKEAVYIVDGVYGLGGSNRCQTGSIDADCLDALLSALTEHGYRESLGGPLLERLRRSSKVNLPKLMASSLASRKEKDGRPQQRHRHSV